MDAHSLHGLGICSLQMEWGHVKRMQSGGVIWMGCGTETSKVLQGI
jgi:hypothetical protein